MDCYLTTRVVEMGMQVMAARCENIDKMQQLAVLGLWWSNAGQQLITFEATPGHKGVNMAHRLVLVGC